MGETVIRTPSLMESTMRETSLAFVLGVSILLFNAAIASNLTGGHQEMRGAWVARAMR